MPWEQSYIRGHSFSSVNLTQRFVPGPNLQLAPIYIQVKKMRLGQINVTEEPASAVQKNNFLVYLLADPGNFVKTWPEMNIFWIIFFFFYKCNSYLNHIIL